MSLASPMAFPNGRELQPSFGWPLGRGLDDRGSPPVDDYIAWFDASDFSTLTLVDGAISQWNDKSLAALNLTQATAANRPLYGKRWINGLGCAWFDGVNDRLDSSVPHDDRTQTSFVAGVLETSGVATFLGCVASTGGNGLRFNARFLETNRENIAGVGAQSNAQTALGRPFVAVQRLTDTAVTHYLNGVSETDANATAFSSPRVLSVGSERSATGFYLGAIGEILMYGREMSDDEVRSVATYLSRKWGRRGWTPR